MNFNKYLIFVIILFSIFNFWVVLSVILKEKSEVKYSTNTETNKNERPFKDVFLGYTYLKTEKDLRNPLLLKKNIDSLLIHSKLDTIQLYRYVVRNVYQPILENLDTNNLKYEPLEILEDIKTGENFNFLATNFQSHELYLKPISELYFIKAKETLFQIQRRNSTISKEFEFQYLIHRCAQNNFIIDQKISYLDKFLNTLLDEDYFHLLNASWNKSSIKLKFVMFSILIVELIGIYNVLNCLIKYFNKLKLK